MLKRLIPAALILIVLLALIPPAAAQSPQGERVELEAVDGLTLVGLYYAPPDSAEPQPAVLLQHHYGSVKEAWLDFIPTLLDAGYGVLTVDLRGHGETGSDMEWTLAEDDTQRWLDWLRAQPGVDPDRISLVGSSIGADVGIRVMVTDERLVTLVGLSMLLDAEGVMTEEAVKAIGKRPLFLVAGRGVEAEAHAAITLLQAAQGYTQLRLYDTSACCQFLLMIEDDLSAAIITWLDTYSR